MSIPWNRFGPPPSIHRIEVYRSGLRRQWRWRYRHSNGNILAHSGEAYARRIDALQGAATVTGAVIPKDHPFGVSYLPGRRVEVCEVTR